MAWLGIIIIYFIYLDMQITQFIMSGSIEFLHPIPEERNNRLVWAGIEPRSSCFKSDCSNN